jgi:hypothetical protein
VTKGGRKLMEPERAMLTDALERVLEAVDETR